MRYLALLLLLASIGCASAERRFSHYFKACQEQCRVGSGVNVQVSGAFDLEYRCVCEVGQ